MQRGDGGGARDTFDQAQQTGRGFSPEHDNFEGSSGLLFEQAMAQTRMAVCLSDPRQEDDPIVFCNKAANAESDQQNAPPTQRGATRRVVAWPSGNTAATQGKPDEAGSPGQDLSAEPPPGTKTTAGHTGARSAARARSA